MAIAEAVFDAPLALGRVRLLLGLSEDERTRLARYLDVTRVPAGTNIVREGDVGRDMFLLLDGSARLARRGTELGALRTGDHFGELGLVEGRARAASVVAATDCTLARLPRARFEAMGSEEPALAAAFSGALVGALGRALTEMTDNVSVLLRERSLPRRTQVTVRVAGEERVVATGSSLRSVLPAMVDGRPVLAALLDKKPVSLHTRLSSDATIEPLTADHLEGRKIYQTSVGLLLLEAARRVDPGLVLRLGPTVGDDQEVEVVGGNGEAAALATRIGAVMRELVDADVPFREEWWTVEEAASHFEERGWNEAVLLLREWREETVPLVSCGEVYALALAPLAPGAGALRGFTLVADGEGLVLRLNGARNGTGSRGRVVARSAMVTEHALWLNALGVRSVGAFNASCVSGQVAQLIRVSEGFHEKRIGQIADEITRRGARIRAICIAGPSSSGKTTFIRRLTVQLLINGITPVGLGLDDYYCDREKTPTDAHGEFDFEAFDAIDHQLLQKHIRRMIAGEPVHTARYDFARGRSAPEGGPELTLRPGAILMLEGIHALNPRLLASILEREQAYRIFVQPVTSLPFDRLTRVSAGDLRLLRRIVRDRHSRGWNAAQNIARWPSVRAGELAHIFPYESQADVVFDTSLVYEPAVLKVYAERYLLEVPQNDPAYTTAYRLRRLIDRFVAIYPDHVPSTSILREFIGGSGFEY